MRDNAVSSRILHGTYLRYNITLQFNKYNIVVSIKHQFIADAFYSFSDCIPDSFVRHDKAMPFHSSNINSHH